MTNVPSDAVPIAIPTEVFDLPVHEMRRGYRSDVYFWRRSAPLERIGHREVATVQVFQKQQAVLCGVEESLAILLLGVGHYRDPARAFDWFDELIELKKRIRSLYRGDPVKLREALEQRRRVEGALDKEWISHADDIKVYTLRDGDPMAPMETALLIEGPLGSSFISRHFILVCWQGARGSRPMFLESPGQQMGNQCFFSRPDLITGRFRGRRLCRIDRRCGISFN
ncbi:MAG: hypothetical protein Ct9H300mP13_6570 [Gammaproteobacteria bacterium]|nr:MAG: hypothetical protein Ct9H300mP13_6570 [Gammaproteobacteria bacterium]